MESAWLAIQAWPIPIKHSIRRIRVLLNFKNHQASANGMDAAAREEHGIACPHVQLLNAIFHGAVMDFLLELLFANSAFQSHIQFCSWNGIRDIPHLRLGFAAQFTRLVWRGMNLQR